MAAMILPTPEEKWTKLATDYVVVLASMVVVARSRFQCLRMWDGDIVIHTHHRLYQFVNECIIQALVKQDDGSSHTPNREVEDLHECVRYADSCASRGHYLWTHEGIRRTVKHEER